MQPAAQASGTASFGPFESDFAAAYKRLHHNHKQQVNIFLCLQIKGTAPIQIGTYATVLGGLIGVGVLAYLGLKL